MKKRNKIILNSLMALGVISSISVGALGLVYGIKIQNSARKNAEESQKNNHKKDINHDSSKSHKGNKKNFLQKYEDSKYNYVALGDSVSAGFSILEYMDKKDYKEISENIAGEKTKTGITGYSYPSFIARTLEKENKLNEYKNFSFSGFTTGNLLHMLNSNFKTNKNDDSHFQIAKKIRDYNNNIIKDLKNRIEKASLVSLSIGGNDLLQEIKIGGMPFTSIISQISKGKFPKGMKLTIDQDHFLSQIKYAFSNIEKIIMEINAINKNTKIVITKYPMAILQFKQLLELMTKNKDGIALSNELFKQINSLGERISQKFSNVDFIDDNNDQFWDDNSAILSKSAIDIHPTIYGQRVMAGEVLTHLTGIQPQNVENYKKNNEEYSEIRIPTKTKLEKENYLKDINELYNLNIEPDNAKIEFGDLGKQFCKTHKSVISEIMKNIKKTYTPKVWSMFVKGMKDRIQPEEKQTKQSKINILNKMKQGLGGIIKRETFDKIILNFDLIQKSLCANNINEICKLLGFSISLSNEKNIIIFFKNLIKKQFYTKNELFNKQSIKDIYEDDGILDFIMQQLFIISSIFGTETNEKVYSNSINKFYEIFFKNKDKKIKDALQQNTTWRCAKFVKFMEKQTNKKIEGIKGLRKIGKLYEYE